jgi:CubicO group peptidase (beta-lactamase class C family)
VTAAVAGILAQNGVFDPDAPISEYVDLPEGSAYADCVVQNVLDMNVALDFEENYDSTAAEYTRYRRATGWNPVNQNEPVEGTESLIVGLKKSEHQHGDAFRYRSPNSDMLGIILERATGVPFARLMSEHLWQPMHARGEAYITVDYFGAPRTAGGICCTLADLARLGQLIADNGRNQAGEQVLPTAWLTEICEGGDREAWKRGDFVSTFPEGRYRNKWYQVGNEDQGIFAMGIYGQYLYINPRRNVVVARVASHPVPVDQPDKTDIMDAMQILAGQY